MKSLLVFLGLVSVSLAAIIGVRQEKESAPARCCVPKTMQINVFGAEFYETSKPYLVPIIATYGGKINEGLAALKIYDEKTRQLLRHDIMDFNKQVMYNISADGSCVKSAFKSPQPSGCIPDSAVFDASFTMGIGENSLVGNIWYYKDASRNLEETVSVTGSCIPILLQQNTNIDGGKTHKGVSYVHAEMEIIDKDLFTIPDTCKASNEEKMLIPQGLPVPFFMLMPVE